MSEKPLPRIRAKFSAVPLFEYLRKQAKEKDFESALKPLLDKYMAGDSLILDFDLAAGTVSVLPILKN